ncbi:GNAT family N-acetyltransferase [Mucilaginibacter sp.]|uniref:GNAT family N-acetyltransferase n=1 Tax=Mucilaginibacter sp. TaxID=1882438 RepID=UPI003AFFFC21
MNEKIKVNEATNQFELETPEGLALITYEIQGNAISIMHTEVPEAAEGQGIGSELAGFALDYARQKQLKVQVYCKFVQAYLQKHPQYQDLIS